MRRRIPGLHEADQTELAAVRDGHHMMINGIIVDAVTGTDLQNCNLFSACVEERKDEIQRLQSNRWPGAADLKFRNHHQLPRNESTIHG